MEFPYVQPFIGALLLSFVARAYLPTAFATVPGGDSGELIAEACQLGVAHPPGYPLFVYFAQLAMVMLAPFGLSPAFSVNVACCVLGCVTSLLLYITSANIVDLCGYQRLSRTDALLVAAVCAALAAISPLTWLYSIGAEVFALNNFFVALLAWHGSCYALSLLNDGSSRRRYFLLTAAAMCGLAMCNQHTVSLFIIPLAAWIVLSQLYVISISDALLAVAAGLAGLLPYAHMPIWHTIWRGKGSWGDTSTFRGFVRHLLRQDYGTFRLVARSTDEAPIGLATRNAAYVANLWNEQMPFGLPLLLAVGALASFVMAARAWADYICGGHKSSASAAASSTKSGNKHQRSSRSSGGDGSKHSLPPAISSSSGTTTCSSPDRQQRWERAFARSYPAFLVAAYVFYFAVFHSLSNMSLADPLLYGVHARFWIQPNLLAFLILAVGVIHVMDYAAGVAAACFGTESPSANNATCTTITRANNATTMTRANNATMTTTTPAHAAATKSAPRFGGCYSAVDAHTVITVVAVATLCGALYLQYTRTFPRLDNSTNDVIARYGHALLDPLPMDAILLTGYDFQWTSTRYLQACEGVRPDVDVFNAPIMSFSWFQAAQPAYAEVIFPGTHLVGHLTAPHAEGGFSLADFLTANSGADGGDALMQSYERDPPHPSFATRNRRLAESSVPMRWPEGRAPHGVGAHRRGRRRRVFMSGVGSMFPADKAHLTTWDLRPYGIVEEAVARSGAAVSTWRNFTSAPAATATINAADVTTAVTAWSAATRIFNGVDVPVAVFDASSWERATRLDYYFRAVNYATWLLEWALLPSSSRGDPSAAALVGDEDFDAEIAIAAVRIMEAALAHQREVRVARIDPHLLKNIGLAYVRLVRSRRLLPRNDTAPWPCLPRSANSTSGAEDNHSMSSSGHVAATPCVIPSDEESFRVSAARRVLDAWTAFLATEEGTADPGVGAIRQVVGTLNGVLHRAAR